MDSSDRPAAPLRLRLLGPMVVERDGLPLALPPSRKVRGLIAHLALAPSPLPRSRLTELLWDLPNDPRGELRWCLSKARALLDEPGRQRVRTDGDRVQLDLADAEVDALEVHRAAQSGFAGLPLARLRTLAAAFGGEFLQGQEIERSAPYSAWLIGQRRRFRAAQAAVLQQLAQALPPAGDEALAVLEQWLALAPFDRSAHERLLAALAARGALREGDEHLAATARRFEAEGQDWAPIGRAWRAAKAGQAAPATAPMPPIAFSAARADTAPDVAPDAAPARAHRASIAVMPFADRSGGGRGGLADGLAHDVITRLAKLRSVFVIAPGTVFALAERRIGAEEAGRTLGVDYVAGGSLRDDGGGLVVTVQLSETRSARIVWADEFAGRRADTLAVLDEIGNRIVVAIAHQIEAAERNRAVLKPPSSLDAWEAHHRGLWHMVRFDRADNAQAQQFFATAVRLDPTFARPWAGLSFTHWQNAFQGWGEREPEVELAYRNAAQALMADEHDPTAHWAMGRALWLRGRQEESLAALHSSVELSPNFALGHYALAFVQAQSGNAEAAIRAADHSRALSPYDPLLFAMLATRAIALLRLGRAEEAADWGLRAAARPNAHAHILGVASLCLAFAGRDVEAHSLVAGIHRTQPDYRIDGLLRAFRFDAEAEASMRHIAPRIGLG